VFDALGLTEEERKEVYRAVCQLVWERISKARSVRRRWSFTRGHREHGEKESEVCA